MVGEGRGGSRVRLKGWVRQFAHPFVVLGAGGKPSMLLLHWRPSFFFFFSSRLFRSGSWGFYFVFVPFRSEFAPAAHAGLFPVACSLSVFRCWRRSVFRCRCHSRGAQVPACLRSGLCRAPPPMPPGPHECPTLCVRPTCCRSHTRLPTGAGSTSQQVRPTESFQFHLALSVDAPKRKAKPLYG